MNAVQPTAVTPYEAVLGKAKVEISAFTQTQEYKDLSDEARGRKVGEIQQRANAEAARLAEADMKQANLLVERADKEWVEARKEERAATNPHMQLLANDNVRVAAMYAVSVEQIDAELEDAFESHDIEAVTAWARHGLQILLSKAHEHGVDSEWSERYPAWQRRINEMRETMRSPRVTKATQMRTEERSKREATRRNISSAAHFTGYNGYGSQGPLSAVAATLPGAGGGMFQFEASGVDLKNYIFQYGG